MKRIQLNIHYFFCIPSKKFGLTTLCILLMTAGYAQTLSNLTLLQRKRKEISVNDISTLIGTSNNFNRSNSGATIQQTVEQWQSISRYIRDNPEEIAELLEMHSQYSNHMSISIGSEDPKMEALAFTILALQKREVLNDYFSENGIGESSDERKAIEAEIAAIKTEVNKMASPTVTVFATGNIRSIATSKSSDPVASGTGSIGVAYASSKFAVSAHLSVASTQDTIQSNFGSLILAPSNGKTLKSAMIEFYPRLSKNHWLHFYNTFASSFWQVDKDSLGNGTAFKSASTIGFGALYHYRVFEGQIAETEVGLDVEAGIVGRWLHGDIRNMLNDSTNTKKYLNVFPSEKSFYTGLEGGLALNFGQVVGALQAFYLFPKKDEPIDGLTGLQISVGVSVRGDLIRGFLNGKR